jgi:hypothetical protein
MSDLTRLQSSQAVQITDDSSQSASVSTGPSGMEAGLITRNIPYGTQIVSGTVNTNADSNISPGTAPKNALVAGQIYNSIPPIPISGQTLALQSDNSGNLKVTSIVDSNQISLLDGDNTNKNIEEILFLMNKELKKITLLLQILVGEEIDSDNLD